MAREGGGGGGALIWAILGVAVGVAGTLAVETLLSHRAPETVEQPANSSGVAVETSPQAPALAPVVAPIVAPPSAAPVSAAPASVGVTSSQEDVEDDAAAVGMTSRSRPAQAPASN